jgi:hypothetical protein
MRRIRGRAVKALRSGRSQLCWRGFESKTEKKVAIPVVAVMIAHVGDSAPAKTTRAENRTRGQVRLT